MHQGSQGTFVRDSRLEALGNQVAFIKYVTLEVAVFAIAALLHRAYRTHAPVVFETFTMRDDQFAGTLIDAGQQASQHHSIGTGSDSFGDIARILNATIADDRHTVATCGTCAVINRGDLRHANTGDDPCRTDRVVNN